MRKEVSDHLSLLSEGSRPSTGSGIRRGGGIHAHRHQVRENVKIRPKLLDFVVIHRACMSQNAKSLSLIIKRLVETFSFQKFECFGQRG